MNRIHKVIWSQVKNAYVVVSEFSRNYGKVSSKQTRPAINSHEELLMVTETAKMIRHAWQGKSLHYRSLIVAYMLTGMVMGGAVISPVQAASVIVTNPKTTIDEAVNASGANDTLSEGTLSGVDITSKASGGTIEIKAPVTATFFSFWSKIQVATAVAGAGVVVDNSYTGQVTVADNTAISLTGKVVSGGSFSGSALGVYADNSNANIFLGDNVNLSYMFNGGNSYHNGRALFNRGGTVSTGSGSVILAVSDGATEDNLVGAFNCGGGSMDIGSGAVISSKMTIPSSVTIPTNTAVYGVESGSVNDTVRSSFHLGDDSKVSAELTGNGDYTNGTVSALAMLKSDFSLGNSLQLTTTVTGRAGNIAGMRFNDAEGTVGSGLNNEVTLNSTNTNVYSAQYVSGISVQGDNANITLSDGSKNTVTVNGHTRATVIGSWVSGGTLNLGNQSETDVTVHGTVSTTNGRIAGLTAVNDGSVITGGTGTQINVVHDTGYASEVVGLDAQFGGSIQLGGRRKYQRTVCQQSQSDDSQ